MKERLVTLGLALGAFVLFYALFVPKPASNEAAIALPVSTEGRDAGYQGLWRWLQTQGIRVVSFRDRYGRLAQQDLANTGNLLITTLPQKVPARDDEARKLDEWLERGNTLLVVAALDDTPTWALGATRDFLNTLTRLTGLAFSVIVEKKPDAATSGAGSTISSLRQAAQLLLAPQRDSIIPRGSHPLLAGVKSIATQSENPASRWAAHSINGSLVLELGERAGTAQESSAAEAAIWLRRNGKGQIIVLAFASPISNALIGEPDNARMFANIVAWSVSGQGAVIFDDAHQGLAGYYDAKAFFADPRLHRSLLWLGLLWLMFVLGWQRLRPHTDGWKPADVTNFITVTGGFLAGRVAPNLAGQRLCENFFNRIRQRLALPQNGEPVWDWLAAQASIPARDLEHLQQLHARTRTRQRVNLVQLQNCLTRITGKLI
ncbi:MAG: DUF4350 domain-containing protein [Steroidobacteraceae bacterium]